MLDALRFPARDGRSLAATHFDAQAPRGAVVLAGAMGVSRGFYAPFASFLAERGFHALTFDYRGIGESRGAPRDDRAIALHDWGERDLAGAFDFMRARHPALPLQLVAHSVGGQLFGLVSDAPAVGAVFVGSQSGHWRHWKGLGRLGMWGLWHAALPTFAATLGRIPMRAIGQGEDLPGGVGAEWARWGRHRDYVWSYAAPRGGLGFARWTGPLTSYAISDDGYAPRAAVAALAAMYTQAIVELREVHPSQVGEKRVGHFGVFRERLRDLVWGEIARTLARNGAAAQP